MKLTGAKNKEMLITIRESFRKGIQKSEPKVLNNNIIKAYDVLKDIGGKKLVGRKTFSKRNYLECKLKNI